MRKSMRITEVDKNPLANAYGIILLKKYHRIILKYQRKKTYTPEFLK